MLNLAYAVKLAVGVYNMKLLLDLLDRKVCGGWQRNEQFSGILVGRLINIFFSYMTEEGPIIKVMS